MKKFRFKFSPAAIILLVVISAFAACGTVWNVFNIIELKNTGGAAVASYAIIMAVAALLFVFALSVLLFGYYVVSDGKITARFGIVKTVIPVSEAVQFTLFSAQNKLVLFTADQKYTVIVIDEKDYDAFIEAVRLLNPKIIFTRSDGESD